MVLTVPYGVHSFTRLLLPQPVWQTLLLAEEVQNTHVMTPSSHSARVLVKMSRQRRLAYVCRNGEANACKAF